jgi:dTDP-4-dehydrorhamnose reductase
LVKLKVLVTGSAGLVGRQVVKDLSNSHQVFSCYNESKPEYGDSVKMDLKNHEMISSVLTEKKPEIVIHLGAMTGVDLCEKERTSASEINTKATEIIAKECSKLNSFLVYVSTDYVFDGNLGMYKEDNVTNPLGFYGESKLEGEKVVQNFSTNWCIARTSTPFGLHPTKKSFPMWVIENLQKQKQIDILIDQFTSPTYIPNLSRMLIEISERRITGVIHAAGASKISRYQMASMVSDKLNLDGTLLKQISINKMKWVARRPKDSSLDVSRASSILNEKPQKIDQSLNLFIDEMKSTN